MVQILPPAKNIGSYIGQSFGTGAEKGSDLATKLLPILMQLKANQNVYGGGEGIGVAGGEGATTPTGQQNNPIPAGQQTNYPSPSSSNQVSPSPPSSRPRNEGIFSMLTPQEIEAKANYAARQPGGDFTKRQTELMRQNDIGEANRVRLQQLAEAQGLSGRESEIIDFAATRPDLRTVEQVIGAAKKEFDKGSKLDLPGFWTGLTGGAKARADALKSQTPFAQAMKKSGREQELRSTYAEQGLSQTEISYLFNPPSAKIEKEINNLPDGMFKEESITGKAFDHPSEQKYRKELKEHPAAIEKQNERLSKFFQENVTPETSLLVLRDKLWEKGYDWQQIADAFDSAFPDANKLNTDQFAELAEIHQAPIPSLSHLFGPGFFRRLPGVLQGKK